MPREENPNGQDAMAGVGTHANAFTICTSDMYPMLESTTHNKRRSWQRMMWWVVTTNNEQTNLCLAARVAAARIPSARTCGQRCTRGARPRPTACKGRWTPTIARQLSPARHRR